MLCDSLHACFNPIMVDNHAAFFNCTPVGQASDSMMARLKAIHFSWLEPEFCCSAHRGSTGVFLLLQIFSDVVWCPGLSIARQLIVSLSPRF